MTGSKVMKVEFNLFRRKQASKRRFSPFALLNSNKLPYGLKITGSSNQFHATGIFLYPECNLEF